MKTVGFGLSTNLSFQIKNLRHGVVLFGFVRQLLHKHGHNPHRCQHLFPLLDLHFRILW